MQETASSPWGESYAISFHSGTFGVLKAILKVYGSRGIGVPKGLREVSVDI